MNKLMKEFLCVALVALVFATLAACGSPAAKPEATQAPQPAAEENSAPAEAEYFCEDNSLLLRKGSGSEDVSGDYNVYAKTWEVEFEGLKLQCSGSEDGVKLVRWTRDGYSYSLSFNAGEAKLPGLSEDMVTAVVGLFR